MLAIFHKCLANPPEELNSPSADVSIKNSAKQPQEILRDFQFSHPTNFFSARFGGGAVLASSCGGIGVAEPLRPPFHQRLFSSLDNIYCIFVGRLDNLSSLNRQYGLTAKSSNEAILCIEAYRTLRDRSPYPADQVLRDLIGSFAFVVFDSRSGSGSIFAALSGDGKISLHWGIASEGSVVISDDVAVVKSGCGKSFAPFPTGCMFHSESGLKSFESPMNKMKAMPRVDSEGAICGAFFKVDSCAKISAMPRVGSAANWGFCGE